MYSFKRFLSLAMAASVIFGMAACSRNAVPVEETIFSESTTAPFTPIEITEGYTGPVLGVKKWHIKTSDYSFNKWKYYCYRFIDDDNGTEFASYASVPDEGSAYLADLDGDGTPELVCNEQTGPFGKMKYHTKIYRLNNGMIEYGMYCLGARHPAIYGEYDTEEETYPLFAEANGIKITAANCEQFFDKYYPDKNKVLLTSEGSGKQYELNYQYLAFHPEKTVGMVTQTTTASKASVDGKIEYKTSEPSVTDVSDASKKVAFYRDGNELEGKLYLPKGKGPFPVVILACGLAQPYTDYEDKAKAFADNGYAAVVFSFYGNTEGKASANGATMLSQVKDLYAVMDSIGFLPSLNKERVYLWGHSFGGRVVAYVASRRVSEIKGLLLVEPTINDDEHVILQDSPEISVNIFNMLKKIRVHTVIYMGTHDGFGDNPGAFDKVLNTLPSGRLVTIDGSDHFFNDKYGQKMVEDACKQMRSWDS